MTRADTSAAASPRRHVLFSVAGETPAVVTETLFGLHDRDVTAGEVHILTTAVGRGKTMGLYLAQAMTWFARPWDDLSHVLVTRECEQDREFFFPLPEQPAHRDVVDFSLIPFVRMSGLPPPLLGADRFGYSDRVALSEHYLSDRLRRSDDPDRPAAQRLTLAVEGSRRILRLDGLPVVKLTPLGAGLYLFLFQGLTRLNKDLRTLWRDAGFGVFADTGRSTGGGASRWVNIAVADGPGQDGLWVAW
jgi:hypothetical protein